MQQPYQAIPIANSTRPLFTSSLRRQPEPPHSTSDFGNKGMERPEPPRRKPVNRTAPENRGTVKMRPMNFH